MIPDTLIPSFVCMPWYTQSAPLHFSPFIPKELTSIDNCFKCTSFFSLSIYITYKAVNCNELPVPSNGERTYSGRNYNSRATFSCNTGYRLRGSSSRTCQSSGQWSGTQPSCAIGEYVYTLLCIHSNEYIAIATTVLLLHVL